MIIPIIINGPSGCGKTTLIELADRFDGLTSYSDAADQYGFKAKRGWEITSVNEVSSISPYSEFLYSMKYRFNHNVYDNPDNMSYKALSSHLRDAKDRNCLVKLKQLFESEFPGITNEYVERKIQRIDDLFSSNKDDRVSVNICFISIREPEQIKDFCSRINSKVYTLYLTKSDLNVTDGFTEDVISTVPYDYRIENNGTVEDLFGKIQLVLHEIFKEKGLIK